HVETIMEHLVKLTLSPAERPRRGWLVTVDKQRARLARKLTPPLRTHLESELPALYAGLRRPGSRQLDQNGARPNAVPSVCLYTLDQLLEPDWYPDNAQGRREP
ncbi:MAG: hypothetical protein K0R41_4498, partial [Geminicoccaceae bacterium]|nr:hypothetical protein [Geminicoccaceae bacterium]